MAGILWAVVAILLILWILSFVAFHLGTILWLFLVAAIVVAIINFFSGGFANRSV